MAKRCSRCKTLKPLEDFPPCKTGKHGVYNYCRECHTAYQKEKNPNRIIIDEKKARSTGLKKLGLKTCTSCKTVQPLDNFYNDPRHACGKQSMCKECWKQPNRDAYLYREYGLTTAEFHQLLDAQDGRCAICNRTPKKYRFNIDHCHVTNRIRALLCVNCNTNLLPFVEQFPEWIKKAFDYLVNPPAFKILGERQVPETNQARCKGVRCKRRTP